MRNDTELEFNRLGVEIGDEIEVQLFSALINRARFVLTEEICERSHFPIKTSNGYVEYCHLDHIDKSKIVVINKK
jgi:hypothetical protein